MSLIIPPPAIVKPAFVARQILRGATQAAGHQRRVRNRSPGGVAESQPTTTVVLGASEDRSGSASTYRLPIGAKHAVAPDLFTRVTPAGRSSKIKNRGPGTAVEPVLLRETSWKYSFKLGS